MVARAGPGCAAMRRTTGVGAACAVAAVPGRRRRQGRLAGVARARAGSRPAGQLGAERVALRLRRRPDSRLEPARRTGLAWVDQRRKAVLVQRYGGDGRALPGAPVEASRSPETFSWLPRLAFAPDEDRRLYVLWQEIVFSGGSHGGEIFLAVSRDGGRSFDRPLNLSNSVPGDGKGRLTRDVWHNGSFDIVAGAGGLVIASWTEYDGRLWVARSADRSNSRSRAW